MDLFDSATAEMKKKRNQKKDGSVLRQMKINSKEVVPSEWVFESDGSLRKIRSIFAVYESDDSPVCHPDSMACFYSGSILILVL